MPKWGGQIIAAKKKAKNKAKKKAKKK